MFKLSAQTADFLGGALDRIDRKRCLHDMAKLAPNVPYRPRWFREPCQGEQWCVYVPHDRAPFGTGYRVLMEPQ